MKKLLIPILLLFTILIYSNSCKKSKTATVYNSEFPNNKGTWWKYKVYDSIYNYVDTITITVNGETKINNGLDTKIWVIKSWYQNTTDTDFVYSSPEGIKIFEDRFSMNFKKNYVFPLLVGNTWIGSFTGEIYNVLSKETASVPYGIVNNCFKINRNWRQYNQQVKETELFLPNVGLVRKTIDIIDAGYFLNQVWELHSLNIK